MMEIWGCGFGGWFSCDCCARDLSMVGLDLCRDVCFVFPFVGYCLGFCGVVCGVFVVSVVNGVWVWVSLGLGVFVLVGGLCFCFRSVFLGLVLLFRLFCDLFWLVGLLPGFGG